MSLLQRLEMRQGQALVMTPQLLQAIKLLQLSQLDLAAYVDAELERNPLLERAEGESGPSERRGRGRSEILGGSRRRRRGRRLRRRRPSPGSPPTLTPSRRRDRERPRHPPRQRLPRREPDPCPRGGRGRHALADAGALRQHRRQLRRRGPGFRGDPHRRDLPARASRRPARPRHPRSHGPADRRLPDRCRRRCRLPARDPSTSVAERLGAVPRPGRPGARSSSRASSPPGIAARDLAECLAIQLRERDRFDPAMQALVSRLDLVAKRDFAALRRLCGVDDEDLVDMLAEIRRLDPEARPRLRVAGRRGADPRRVRARRARRLLAGGAQRRGAAAGAGQPELLRPRLARRGGRGRQGLPVGMPADRQLAHPQPGAAGPHHPQGRLRDRAPAGRRSSCTASRTCAR